MTVTRGKSTVTLENFTPNENYNEIFVKIRSEINKLCLGKRTQETNAFKNIFLDLLTNLNKQYDEKDNLTSMLKTLNSDLAELHVKCNALEKKSRDDHIFIQECIDEAVKLESEAKKQQNTIKDLCNEKDRLKSNNKELLDKNDELLDTLSSNEFTIDTLQKTIENIRNSHSKDLQQENVSPNCSRSFNTRSLLEELNGALDDTLVQSIDKKKSGKVTRLTKAYLKILSNPADLPQL